MNLKKLAPLMFLSLTNIMAFSILFPVLAPFIRSLGLPDVAYGVVTASYFISLMFGSFVVGRLADRFGRKRMLLISNFGTLVGWILMFASAFLKQIAFPLLVVSRLVDGFTGGNTSIVQAMASDMVEKREKTKVFGLMGSTFGIGMILGPFLGGVVYDTFGFAGTAVFSFSMTLFAMLFLWLGVDEPRMERKKAEMDYSRVWKPAIIRFASSVLFSSFTTIFPLFLMDRFGVGASGIGMLFMAIGIMSIINQSMVVPAIEKRLGRKTSLVLASVMLGTSFALVYLSHSVSSVLLSNYLFNLGGIMFVPIIKSCLVEIGPAGEAMGIDESVRAAARSVSPVVSSYIYQLLGPASLLYIGPAGGLLLAIVSFLVL